SGESHVEPAVPAAVAAPVAAAQADAFRAAREAVTAALGKPSVMGSHGDLGPFYDSGPLRGAPFVRWCGRPDTLELRARKTGPELVEPKGRALAEMMVATARANGVREPTDLIVGGEAEYVDGYEVTYYGLGLPTG
ncbi:MAG TPA: hypothetical protein VK545_09260, partial [Streptomyces sp.]|nr:hypothetical protein [Streptomyces sp.]